MIDVNITALLDDSSTITHTFIIGNEITKEQYGNLLTNLGAQISNQGITKYDDVTKSAQHTPGSRIREMKMEINERLIITPGQGGIVEGIGKLVA